MRSFTPATEAAAGADEAHRRQRRRAIARATARKHRPDDQRRDSLRSAQTSPARQKSRSVRSVSPCRADDRGELREHEILAERHADFVPGKSGQHERAQPFAGAEADGQRENARRRRATTTSARERKADRREKREPAGSAEHAQRQRPGELVGLDQKGGAEPPEAGDKIAKAPPPADAEGRAHAMARSIARWRRRSADPSISQTAVIIGDQHRRQEVERRQGQGADRAGGEGDRAAPPAPGENDARGERAERIPVAG